MTRIVLVFLFFISCTNIFGQDSPNKGAIHIGNQIIYVFAPEGWMLDYEAAKEMEVDLLMYKKGDTLEKSQTLMYVNVEALKENNIANLDQFIDLDIKNLKKNFSDIAIIDGQQLLVNYKDIAKVKHLSGNTFGNFEARAYMADAKNGISFVMSSKSKEGFESCLNPFNSLVTSYSNVVDNLEVEAGDK
ncbi:MAG: hypothetical protein KA797_04410 [Chitinophagales bacterium]|nr:hypothetical protein [Chitinophagales bacterium]